jgi:hypothetical protein
MSPLRRLFPLLRRQASHGPDGVLLEAQVKTGRGRPASLIVQLLGDAGIPLAPHLSARVPASALRSWWSF